MPPSGVVSLDVRLYFRLTADLVVTGTRTFRNLAEVDAGPGDLVGIAAAASQGVVTARQIETRPLARAGDVLETVPGMVVSQHSGEGKGNQLYLRGFNLDHGTDFATTVAGVPVNLAHACSRTRLHRPELRHSGAGERGPVPEGTVLRGERRLLRGGLVGASPMSPSSRPRSQDSGEERTGGGVSWPRRRPGSATASSSPRWSSTATTAPGSIPDRYRRLNTVLRYSRGDRPERDVAHGTGPRVRLGGHGPDSAPPRVDAGLVSRFGDFDPTLGGDTERYALSGEAVALETDPA